MPQEINTVSGYQTGNFPFPKDDIDPKKKDSRWHLKYSQAIYSAYVQDNTGVIYSKIDEMIEDRLYAEGRQDVLKYKKLLLDESENTSEMEGWINVNWEPIPVLPKFIDIIQGIFEDQEHKAVATAVDPKSSDEKLKIKIRKWFKGRYKPMLEAIQAFTGEQEEPEWIPETVDELELYEKAGGLKLVKETEIEEALTYSWYISDWKEIKRKMLEDFSVINCAAVKDFTDKYTQKAKARYVDPTKLIIQYSRHWDHRNSEYAGELITESVSNLRKLTDLTEDQLRRIAEFNNGRFSNRTISSWAEEDLYDQYGNCKFDDFQIEVMDSEWFSINSEYRTKRTNDRNETVEYSEKWGKIHDTEKKKTSVKDIKVVYRCKWIVGTDFVYDWGLQYDVPRPGKKEVELSFKFYKLKGRSIVNLAKYHVDQICLTSYKLQNSLAQAAPSGIAVEYTSLQNMKFGGNKMEPKDILSIRRGTGDYLYKATTHRGMPNLPGTYRPIQELAGGIGPSLDEYVRLFELHFDFIRELTGINKIADATTPDPNQSVKGSQLAIAATNNALRPIYSGYIRLKEMVARSLALRIQISLAHNENMYEGYVPVVGSVGAKILSLGAGVVDADWSIMIQAKPTQQRKELLLQSAMEAMKRDKDGYTDLEYKDLFMIERLLEEGNEKLAELILTHQSEKNKQMKIQLQRENMKLDQQSAQAIQAQKAQEKLSEMEKENELKKDFETHKVKLERDLEYDKHLWKLDEIEAENEKFLQQQNNLKSA